MKNFPQTILSQYADSPRILAILSAVDEWISPDTDLEAFYRDIWDIRTAAGYGLDVWGRIVGISRVVTADSGSYFGFGEAGDRTGFNQGPFYGGAPATTNFTLTDQAYRLLILTKAAYNITECSIPAINRLLMALFPGRGTAYVTDGRSQPRAGFFGFGEAGDRLNFDDRSYLLDDDGVTFLDDDAEDRMFVAGGGASKGPFMDALLGDLPDEMTLTYVFEFALRPFEVAIVTNSGVLPRPVGVRAFSQYNTV